MIIMSRYSNFTRLFCHFGFENVTKYPVILYKVLHFLWKFFLHGLIKLCSKYIATARLGKVLVDYVTPHLTGISSLYDVFSSWISLFYRDKANYFLLIFFKMVIPKISRDRNILNQHNLPIRIQCINTFLTQTTSQSDVSAVYRFNNSKTKLLPSPSTYHSLMPCSENKITAHEEVRNASATHQYK